MSLYRLRDVSVDGVELHGSHHPLLLSGDADQQQPLHRLVSAIVDYLTSFERAVSVEYFLWQGIS